MTKWEFHTKLSVKTLIYSCVCSSHSRQRAVSSWLPLFMRVTEVQSSLVHPQQLADTLLSVELSVFIHHLGSSTDPTILGNYSLCLHLL